MLTIDLHTHILPESWPDLSQRYGYGDFVRLEHHRPCCARMLKGDEFFREIESNCWDPTQRMRECDRDDVQMQVLSTVPVMFSYWAKPADCLDLSRLLNDHIASVIAAHPKRFLGLGTVPMQDAELAIGELERCVNDLGLCGIQIGTNINGKDLNDPSVYPILEAAQRLSAAVFVHPWEVLGGSRLDQYWGKWLIGMPAETAQAMTAVLLGGVLERLPDLRIAFAHGGGSLPYTLGRTMRGFATRPDLCATETTTPPKELIRRCYLDTLVHDPAALRYLIELMGVDRLAMGSDYPFPLGEAVPGGMIKAMGDLTDDQKSRLLSGTAIEFLGERAASLAVDSQIAAEPDLGAP